MSFDVARSSFLYRFILFAALLGIGFTDDVVVGSKVTRARRNPANIQQPMCHAPPQPDNGEIRLLQNSCDFEDCSKIDEDTSVNLGQGLIYNCDSGYKLEGNGNIAYCIGDGRWTQVPRCVEIKCPGLNSVTRIASCKRYNERVNCDNSVPPETQAEVSCRPGYRKDTSFLSLETLRLTCSEDGKWGPEDTLRCLPVCGQAATRVTPFVINGKPTQVADFPWHASLYMQDKTPKGAGEKKFICGATIIQTNLLMTAAHCVYDEVSESVVDAGKIFVMTGNVFRDWGFPAHDNKVVRRGEVKAIHLRCDYFGLRGHYTSDIAILQLKTPFELSSTLLPACLADRTYSAQILEAGAYGKVAGFGRTATSPSSGVLQAISVPFISYSMCRGSTNGVRNRIYIQPDKFCAGYTNGSAVCEGDSGGGIVFEQNDKWYVMGIVSVGLGIDITNGEKTCDQYSYTLYTKVDAHIDWIQEVFNHVRYKFHLPCSTHTQTTTTTTLSPQKVVQTNLCDAPPQPANGVWKLHRSLCNGRDGPDLDCEIPSGAEVPLHGELVYDCDPGYRHAGENVICTEGGTWSSLPVCIKE